MTGLRGKPLRVLSAGAAKGVVQAIAVEIERETGIRVAATFDSAGGIRSAFEAAPSSEIVILPLAMLETLAAARRVDPGTVAVLGDVPTGIATRTGAPVPKVSDAGALREALLATPALYCPDTSRSTAGLHFAGEVDRLGIQAAASPKLRTFPNGAAAMSALAADRDIGAIGCTQVTEILYTPGVVLAGVLPAPFDLTTAYALAVPSGAAAPDAARAFAARLLDPASAPLLRAAGFLARRD